MTFAEFLRFISQNENYFIGFLIVLGMLTSFTYKLISYLGDRLIRSITIWKKGYPPEHCDVFGEATKKKASKN